ncbi:hypothetical protein LCGC14_2631320, partial [marine sediment metagenome]
MSITEGRRSRASRIWRWVGRHIGPLISLAALAGLVWWASRQGAPSFPTQASKLALVVAAVGVYAVATVARGWRWHKILQHSHIDHRTIDAYALVVVGYMGNTVLPMRGGELVRTVLLGQRSSSLKREIFGSIIAERLLDVVALVLMFALVTWLKVAGSPVG